MADELNLDDLPPTVRSIEVLLREVIDQQEEKVVRIARELKPGISPEDVLQPHDHEELQNDILFNFEDGILVGLRAARTALRGRLYAELGWKGLPKPPDYPGAFGATGDAER